MEYVFELTELMCNTLRVTTLREFKDFDYTTLEPILIFVLSTMLGTHT